MVRHTHCVSRQDTRGILVEIKIMSHEKKPIWKCKTFWLAVLTILLGVTEALQGEIANGGTLTTLGVLQIVVRFLTTTKAVLN